MKCINCGKTIPSSVVECPHCKKDPYILDAVDFGTINSSNYGNDLDIKVGMYEKKSHKKGLIIFLVVVLLIGAGVLAFISSRNKEIANQYVIFNNFIKKVSEKLETRFDEVYTGKYNLDLKVNKDSYNFSGNYEYDLSNRYVYIDGNMDDPNKKNGGIILQDKDLHFNLLINELNMYFESKNINEDAILLPLDNYSLYLNKKVDYSSLIDGAKDAFKGAFKAGNYKTVKEKYNYKNEDITVKKTSLIVDSKYNYYITKAFFGHIVDDSSLLSELSKITTYNEDELTRSLNNFIKNTEYAKNDEMDEIIIDIYYKGNNVYEVNFNKEYALKIVDNTYEFIKYEKGKEKVNLTISKQSEMHQDYEEFIYDFNYKSGKNEVIGTLKLKDNLEANIKKKEAPKSTNLNKLSEEDLKNINSKFNYYFKGSKISTTVHDKLKMKCQKGLSCNCEDRNTCTCLYQNKMITCDYKVVN